MASPQQYIDIFREQFDGIAKYYDELEPVPYELHKIIFDMMPRKRHSCLELGCGAGRLLRMLTPKFETCTALDFSKNMIDIASRRVDDKVEFVHCSIDEMNFKEKSFDYITCCALFHHLYRDRERMYKALKKIKKLLKPGGRLFISDFVTYKFLKSRADWIHYWYLVRDSIKQGDLHIFKKIAREPSIFKKHLITERGMFFTKKEFQDIFGNFFENSKIGWFGRKRQLIKIYYLVWDKNNEKK